MHEITFSDTDKFRIIHVTTALCIEYGYKCSKWQASLMHQSTAEIRATLSENRKQFMPQNITHSKQEIDECNQRL